MNGGFNGSGSGPRTMEQGIPLQRSPDLVLMMNTPKGRGLFAKRNIPAKSVLEVSPVLVLDPVENEQHVRKTDLYNYTYNWPYKSPAKSENTTAKSPTTTQAVIFGLGSMFNHSAKRQNVGWERDVKNLLITYTTLRDIRAGEELCISYGDRLTFKDADKVELHSDDEDWTEHMDIIDLIN